MKTQRERKKNGKRRKRRRERRRSRRGEKAHRVLAVLAPCNYNLSVFVQIRVFPSVPGELFSKRVDSNGLQSRHSPLFIWSLVFFFPRLLFWIRCCFFLRCLLFFFRISLVRFVMLFLFLFLLLLIYPAYSGKHTEHFNANKVIERHDYMRIEREREGKSEKE